MRDRIMSLLVFLGSFSFYLFQAAPSVTAGDAGEFMTAAGTLSLAHAPSFPLYMIWGRCFSELLPFGTLALRLNIFSAFTSASSLLICYGMGRLLGSSRFLSVLVVGVIGLSSSFLANSLVTEVFSLNTFLAVFLLFLLVKTAQEKEVLSSVRYFCAFWFVLGLGLGNHHIVVFLGVGALVYVVRMRSLIQVKFLAMYALFGLLGFSIYLSLPIRSAQNPPLNWGQPTTPSKLARTISRKDYGSFRLALEKSPERNQANTQKHLIQFGKHLALEVPWPLLILSLLCLAWGLFKRSPFAWVLLVLFVFSGPFFYVLGNLPFTSQSVGIMGRFYIMPVVFLLLALHCVGPKLLFLSPLLLFFGVQKGLAVEFDHRASTLVLDYGRAMLRSMPPDAILFMDGGDDAFYSLAMLHFVEGKRPDVTLHDRGGLVFKNPYGPDFRSLSRDDKKNRRADVEKSYVGIRPLFYSTMDPEVLPGSALVQRGFLYEASGPPEQTMSWPLVILRSLYPTHPNDYRTRALAAFFPFMSGKEFLLHDDFGRSLAFFKRAQTLGYDVDWLRVNLGQEYARLGYDSLVRGRLALAQWVYDQWIEFEPDSMQAQSNRGVALEKMGKVEEAREQYKHAATQFPEAADPVFNLAVLAWKEEKWPEVVEGLEEVLRRNPNHLQARAHLEEAKKRLRDVTP